MPGLRWSDEEYAAYLARQGAQTPKRATQMRRQGTETGPQPRRNLGHPGGSGAGAAPGTRLQPTTGGSVRVVAGDARVAVLKKGANLQGTRYKSHTEARFVQEIAEPRKRAGEIAMYAYEVLTLRLAPAVRYTPDFLCVVLAEPLPVLVEVKMWMREDAWQKLKIAAAMYPIFRFELWTYKDKQWTCKQIPSH